MLYAFVNIATINGYVTQSNDHYFLSARISFIILRLILPVLVNGNLATVTHSSKLFFPGNLERVSCRLLKSLESIFLLSRKKIFFEISFFWGIAGGLIANTQPDIRFAFPDPNFILFFFGHGLMWLGIFFSLIVYKVRPYFKTFIKIFFITVLLSPVVYSINSFINYFAEGNPANYWYLMARPDGASIADFLPDPPAQIPIFVLLAFIIFALIYTPFAVWDKLKK